MVCFTVIMIRQFELRDQLQPHSKNSYSRLSSHRLVHKYLFQRDVHISGVIACGTQFSWVLESCEKFWCAGYGLQT
jgi:hypothetical protein